MSAFYEVVFWLEFALLPVVLLIGLWVLYKRNKFAVRGTINAVSSIHKMIKKEPEKIEAFFNSYSVYATDAITPETQHCITDYYAILNYLCTLGGQIEAMYIPPRIDVNKGLYENQLLYEEKLARDIALNKGMKCLDVGCGRGRVATHMADLTGADVTGINIEENQIRMGNINARLKGLDHFVHIQYGNFNEPLQFSDNTFDAAYEIQALSLAQDGNFLSIFRELYRVLKPGAKFSLLDWVTLPAFDYKNPDHLDRLRRVKPLLGAVFTPTTETFIKALQEAGFIVLYSQIPSVAGEQYQFVSKISKFFNLIGKTVRFLVAVHVLDKFWGRLLDRFNEGADLLIDGDREHLWTTVMQVTAVKPPLRYDYVPETSTTCSPASLPPPPAQALPAAIL